MLSSKTYARKKLAQPSKMSSQTKKTKKKAVKNPGKADQHIQKLREKQGYMPFSDHLEELRKRILRALVGVTISSTICMFFYEQIWFYVMDPLASLIKQGEAQNITIEIVTSRMQDDFLIQFKAVLMVGVLITIPYIFFELWGFVLPALESVQKVLSNTILITSIIFFALGTLFARFYVWPLVTRFFLFEWLPPAIPTEDGSLIHTKKFLNIPEYLSFFLSFHFAFGVCFQLPVVSVILSLLGIIKSDIFLNSWRSSTVLIAIVAATLTPPDWISMLALMLPLIALFFLSYLFIFLIEKLTSTRKLL